MHYLILYAVCTGHSICFTLWRWTKSRFQIEVSKGWLCGTINRIGHTQKRAHKSVACLLSYTTTWFDIWLGIHPYITSVKDWVGGSRKWPVLLTSSTVFMLIEWMGGGSKKSPKWCRRNQGMVPKIKHVPSYQIQPFWELSDLFNKNCSGQD